MASVADLMFLPIFLMLVFGMAIFGVSIVPQATADFKHVTNQGISEVMVHSIISTIFNEENSKGIKNYKALSYRLCQGPTAGNNMVSDLEGSPGPSKVLDYMELDFRKIPPTCSSTSSFTNEKVFGSETLGKRTYVYKKKIPVIGGDIVDMRVLYELD